MHVCPVDKCKREIFDNFGYLEHIIGTHKILPPKGMFTTEELYQFNDHLLRKIEEAKAAMAHMQRCLEWIDARRKQQ